MALDFVGVDPTSGVEKCPAVLVDAESGDLILVVKKVTDPATLAGVYAHTPVGDDEVIGRMPARMNPYIQEAIGGSYERGRRGPGARLAGLPDATADVR